MRLRPLASSLGLVFALGPLGCGERAQPATPKAAPEAAPKTASPAADAGTPGAVEAEAPPKPTAANPNTAAPPADPSTRPGAAKLAAPSGEPSGDDRGAGAPLPAGESRPARFADLETLCAALNHDYVDGTLTDYYRDLSIKTEFGADLRRRGEASMKPGRILEAGRETLGERPGDPATPACEQLFDELDDLE